MRRTAIAGLIIGVAASLPYLNTFHNGFVYDDVSRIVQRETLLDWSQLWPLLRHSSRPLRDFTFAVDHALWGMDPPGWHLTNLLWHWAAALAVFFAARRWLGRNGSGAALAAAVLFAVHAVHTEAVTGVSNRQESLMTVFLLASMLAWDRDDRPRLWYAVSLGCAALALAAKQFALVLPLLLLLQDFWFRDDLRRRRLWRYLPFALVIPLMVQVLDRAPVQPQLDGISGWSRLLIMSWAFLKYLGLLVWPRGLTTHHLVLLRETVDGTVLLAWTLVAAAVVMIWRCRRRRPVLGFLAGAYLIAWIPFSNLLPLSWLVAERYLYFPSVFFCCAVAWLLLGAAARQPAARGRVVAAWLVVILLAGAHVQAALTRNRDWRDERTLMTAALRTNPRAYQPHFRLGQGYEQAGDYPQALQHYRAALNADPRSAQAANNAGNLTMRRGEYDLAEGYFKQALAASPDHGTTLFNLACLASLRNQPQVALAWLRRLIAIPTRQVYPIATDPDLANFRASPYYAELTRERAARE